MRTGLGLLLITVLITTAACTRPPTRNTPPRPSPNLVADEVVAAANVVIDEINATAGGPVSAQRAVLDETVATSESERQERCPEATTTLAFDPAYRDLRPAPDGGADEYLLPTYITIFKGSRITGSDVATIRLWISDGTARTAALCVA